MWEQAQGPLALLMFLWCIALSTVLLRAPLCPGGLWQSQHWKSWPADWGGTIFPFLLFCYYEETFFSGKYVFHLRKYNCTDMATVIWESKEKIIGTWGVGPPCWLTPWGSPHAAPARAALYPRSSGWGDMLWAVQNLSAINKTHST